MIAICDHLSFFRGRQLEHEILREPCAVALHLFVQPLRRHAVEFCQIRVKHGDAVKLRWTADKPIMLHLHGYDIETKVEPGAVAEMAFEARATGRFLIEEHRPNAKGGHSHGEAPLVRIEVRPR